MEEAKSKMPSWFGMPINPTGAIFLHIIGIFLLLGLLVALLSIFFITAILVTMTTYFPMMVYYAPLFFYVSLAIWLIFIMIDIYTINIARKAR